jgi:hypothetical protein
VPRLRLLLIEETRAGALEVERLLRPFGDVTFARSVTAARQIIDNGFLPDAVIADLHLADGREWHETVAEIDEISDGAQVAVYAVQVWDGLPAEFARRFPHTMLFEKRNTPALSRWLESLRRDEAGGTQRTMDKGTATSRDDIHEAIRAYARDRGVPHHVNVDRWVEGHISRLIAWEKWRGTIFEALVRGLMTAVAVGLLGWLIWAFQAWVRNGQ